MIVGVQCQFTGPVYVSTRIEFNGYICQEEINMKKLKAMVFFVLLVVFLVLLILPIGADWIKIPGYMDATPFGVPGCYCGQEPFTCRCVEQI